MPRVGAHVSTAHGRRHLQPQRVTPEQAAIAYGDVRAAWRDYLAHHNDGRGFVLISHSQGTFALRQLIREEIDRKPAVRKRLVSALLLGGNVTVRKRSAVGGDFRNVPACRSATQLGCVVAYSTFGTAPPADSLFGRVNGIFSQVNSADASRLEVLCTNPAALGGGSGALRTYIPTTPFPGTVGVGVALEIGPLPSVSTPWVAAPSDYRGRCVRSGGANVLRIATASGARVLPGRARRHVGPAPRRYQHRARQPHGAGAPPGGGVLARRAIRSYVTSTAANP